MEDERWQRVRHLWKYLFWEGTRQMAISTHEDGWIGVDLDGTLAEYHGWSANVGKIIPRMKFRVQRWLAKGYEVRIFTARATDPEQVPVIHAWLEANGLPRLRVTNVKDLAMIELWDDRAVQVVFNTGGAVAGSTSRVGEVGSILR